MKRFVEGIDRGQSTLFPASLDDYVSEENSVRAVDVFVDSLDLDKLGAPSRSVRWPFRQNGPCCAFPSDA